MHRINFFIFSSDSDSSVRLLLRLIHEGNLYPLSKHFYPLSYTNIPRKFPEKIHIGLYHDPIVGLKTDVGYEFEDGQEVSIFDGLDWTLCGDIHKREVLKVNDRPVIMVGSLLQQNFGESVDKHGFCIVDIEKDK